ncbi:TlpA family protein disulfide reductase [Chromohalobacter canadensis]|uniref:Thiol-disulfide isomerase or thioredoxin n=1 Tax=Chromohalobacter canadensis TaxID=141389 RepID=A0A285VUI9_9GAMM|nr:TlpA disulfide reductase family protein [Chromohalobacter canadensis]MCT8468706.1 TlpA family protein disulfide reductase [Chromohalobacter canadensis]MCT8471761.1 TlpA family protein disulfide reductase [Chromohalobacter canadensis]MCT8499214.1 TlpA family protein disulfide reductase [Chromohalobacter canadensis]SOC57557.1 Thiol-disulfide isomerase or thioredoxin [Chromohalobacter canadensis]
MTALDRSVAIGPLALSLGQLLLVFALAVAIVTGALVGRRRRIGVSDTLFTLVFVALLGARLVFIVRYWGSYDSLWAMLDIRDRGFDPWGGLATALVYCGWRLWRAPFQRRALCIALLAGGISWGIAAVTVSQLSPTDGTLPDTRLMTLDGTTVDLLALHDNQPLVVNLWASWCPPCRREMPLLTDTQQRRDDVTFVFVNQGEARQVIRRYLDNESLDLNNVLRDETLALGEHVGVKAMPTTLFYDADGRLVDTHFGELSQATLTHALSRLTSPQ